MSNFQQSIADCGSKAMNRVRTQAFFFAYLIFGHAALAHSQEGSTHSVPLMAAAADPLNQGFVRVVNRSSEAGEVVVSAIDDGGMRYRPITLALAAGQTVHFNSNDLEHGNAGKGLVGGVGPGIGQWRLELRSSLDIEVLSYMRHREDGFPTSMHDLAPLVDGAHYIAFFNPASNWRQESMLRLINLSGVTAQVEINGRDDRGESPGIAVSLNLEPFASRTLTSADLESGSASGLTGALGDGQGKWRLQVRSEDSLQVMSLLRNPSGHFVNLSTVPLPVVAGDLNTYRVPWFPLGGKLFAGGEIAHWPWFLSGEVFVRVINRSNRDGTVEVTAHSLRSDAVKRFPFLPDVLATVNSEGSVIRTAKVSLPLGARSAMQFSEHDLIFGNSAKGLDGVGFLGGWLMALQLRSDLDIQVLSYYRSEDGFLTSVHDISPHADDVHFVRFLNPGRNHNQRSWLSLLNPSERTAHVRVSAVDDSGASPGNTIEYEISPSAALYLTSADLERGFGISPYIFAGPEDDYFEVFGGIGEGTGKWRLRVESDRPIQVMSLMASPTGHVTNMSTVPGKPNAHSAVSTNLATARQPVDAEVDIHDIHLRGLVEAALGKARGAAISNSEMANLRVLDLTDAFAVFYARNLTAQEYSNYEHISDYSGLEAAVNLEHFYGINFSIADRLNFLSELTRLRVLTGYESDSPIDTTFDLSKPIYTTFDLSNLAGLKSLRVLRLGGGVELVNSSALAELTNLEILSNDYGPLDLTPLAELTKLRILEAGCGKQAFYTGDVGFACDLSPLAGLANLMAMKLYIYTSNAASSLTIPALPSLQSLSLDDENAGNYSVSGIEKLTGLHSLDIDSDYSVEFENLGFLTSLTELRALHLGEIIVNGEGPPLSLPLPLAGIDGLLDFRLSSFVGSWSVDDISGLSDKDNLSKVSLYYDAIGDLGLGPLVDNPGLADGDVISIRSNEAFPTADEFSNDISALLRRGVLVFVNDEERKLDSAPAGFGGGDGYSPD